MSDYKKSRLSEDIKRELSVIIKSVKDHRVSEFTNVVRIKLSNDLSYCKVYVSCIGEKEVVSQTIEGLNNASGYIKKMIGNSIKMRKMPNFEFLPDNSLEYSRNINNILNDLKSKSEKSATTLEVVANIINSKNNILIISHANPDCDTLGSGFALYYALSKIGKTAKVVCSDEFPSKYSYFIREGEEQFKEFDPDLVICVDTADIKLLGKYADIYKDKIDICIDHHISNTFFATKTFVDETAAATCEIIYNLIKLLEVDIDKLISTCLYSGISTDTGCFRYSNVTSQTHFIASELFKAGVNFYDINYALFECKSKARLELEQNCISSIEYYHGNRCAITVVDNEIMDKLDLHFSDIEGISNISKNIEGVEVGVTIKEKTDKEHKVSIRTSTNVNASDICKEFGGGGHKMAAGCTIKGDLDEVKLRIVDVCGKYLA